MMEVVVSGDNWSYKTCRAPVKYHQQLLPSCHTDTHLTIQTHRHTDTHLTIQTHRHTSDNTDTQTDRHTSDNTDTQTHRHTSDNTDTQTHRHTDTHLTMYRELAERSADPVPRLVRPSRQPRHDSMSTNAHNSMIPSTTSPGGE